jgi:hypothetical protein
MTHSSGVNLRGALNDTNTTSVETDMEIRDSGHYGSQTSDHQFSGSEFKVYRNFWFI